MHPNATAIRVSQDLNATPTPAGHEANLSGICCLNQCALFDLCYMSPPGDGCGAPSFQNGQSATKSPHFPLNAVTMIPQSGDAKGSNGR